MKSFLILLLASLWWELPACAQSTSVNATISLAAPSPTCSLTGSSSLNYGTAERPGSGSGSVAINSLTGARTASGVVVSGGRSAGQVRLRGENVASYTVSRTFPATLINSDHSLSYAGTWAQSTSSASGYATISASSYSGTASGAGTTFTRYFRFGGTVSGIDLNDGNGTYTGSITATATCN